MATVLPFRGTRYNPDRVGTDISALVCPPVDGIPPARRKSLHDRHPYNFSRLVAPLGPSALTPRAQGATWITENIFIRDPDPIFYVVRQNFTATVGGVDDRFTRTCLVAELEYDSHDQSLLTPFDDPQTSLGSISDGEGTRFLVEPALLSYPDPHGTIPPLLEECLAQPPILRLLDDDSVEHSLHAVRDPGLVEAICAFFRNRTLMVLDGSSWSASSRRLAMLVDQVDPGLFASPVHRVYRGPRNIDPNVLLDALSPDFTIETLPWSGADAASALLASCADESHAFALRWKGSEELILIQLPHGRIQNVSGAIGGSIPTDATILEQVFEERLRSLSLDASPLPVRDAHSTMDVLERLDDGRMAVLLNSCSIETLARIASTGGVVPARSAAFLPRLCCGIVAMPLHGW